MQVRLSFKRILPANGDSTPWPNAIVRTMASDANKVLRRRAGMSLRVVEIVNVPDPEIPSSWSEVRSTDVYALEAFAKQPTSGLEWRTDAVNVFLVPSLFDASLGSVGGFCSFPGHDIIFLSNYGITAEGLGVSLAHELGHYFDLLHTFERANGFDEPHACSSTSPTCETSGDLVCDTPPDPNNDKDLDRLYRTGCPRPDDRAFRALRYNVMSYYPSITPAEAILTDGQIERMRTSAVKSRPSVLEGTHRPAIPAALINARPEPRCVHECAASCTSNCRSQSCRFDLAECRPTCADVDEPGCRAWCKDEWRDCLRSCDGQFNFCREGCLGSPARKKCEQPCREERAFCRTGEPCGAACTEYCQPRCDQGPVPAK